MGTTDELAAGLEIITYPHLPGRGEDRNRAIYGVQPRGGTCSRQQNLANFIQYL
jgi:hypothetical protein